MIKSYKSKRTVSVNVTLRNKKNIHIAFSAQSDGSSVYSTSNEDIQYALEHHRKFGTLFKLVRVESETNANRTKPVDEKHEVENNVKTIKISDFAAAKDYLADTFGISRTSLRSEKSILAAAREHNIQFEGI